MKKLNLFRYVQSIIEDRKNPINLIGITVFDLNEIDNLVEANIDGHRIWFGRSPLAVSSHGSAFGLTLPAEMADGSISALILTDAVFDQMDQDGQNFILLHEQGHVVNGDVDRAWQLTKEHAAAIEGVGNAFKRIKMTQALTRDNRNIENEFAADEYAADRIGYAAAISGLRQISQSPNWLVNKDCRRELRRRIAHLELRRDQKRKSLATKEVI